MKAALYARVSTTDQTCEMQLRELREYAARRGWEVTGEYVDTGWSGAKASRPELDRLMQDARTRRFDAVLVWKLDRWGRSVADCIRTIQELASAGVRFLAVTQNLDTDESNPMSRFLLHLLAAFAEFEREMIRERVIAGIRTAKIKGKSMGRPRRIFRRDEALRLRAKGLSWREIARTLDIPFSTVIDACRQNGNQAKMGIPLTQLAPTCCAL
ncbi:MAG: recombinase family protein [Acidobacteria bacterium]|nr:recombinase family protein [Acidobacteriota bacterium]